MRFYDATVRLGGKLDMQVPKMDLSAPEIILLRAIHGDDAVIDLKPSRYRNVRHNEEYDRLLATYGRAKVGDDDMPVIHRVFRVPPGAPVSLPLALSQEEVEAIEAAGGIEGIIRAEKKAAAEAEKASGKEKRA